MALINKIREKSGWAVGAIAIGLGIFVVGGDLLAPNSRLLGNDANIIGEIAGEDVDYQAFDQVYQQVRGNYEQQIGRAATESELAMIREQAWNQMIAKIALEKEYDRLGIAVTDEELYDMVQGNNVHPYVRQSFSNPQTGEFDVNQVVQYLQNLDQMGPEARPMWANFQEGLVADRIQTKYTNLLSKSVYITNVEAKNFHEAQNSSANLKLLYIPYFSVSDSAVQVTESQMKDYFNRNKEQYKVEDGRSVEFVTIPVTASAEDKTYFQEELNNVTQQLATTPNDSAFVNANSDVKFNGAFLPVSELPEQLRNSLPLETGKVYGPYTDENSFSLHKVIASQEGTTASAKASHILIQPENDTPEAKAAARAKANDLLAQLKNGADFAQLAVQHSSDQGTAVRGGELNWFQEGQMVPAFNNAVFNATAPGLLPDAVETDYGFHIIKVTATKTNRTYKLASVIRSIEVSDATRDAAYAMADELSGISGNLEEFRANAAKNPAFVKEEAANIGKNNILVGNLSNARELVRWAYAKDTSVGNISKVFEIEDNFVVAVLTGKREKGYAKLEDVKDEVTAAVRNELKAKQILAKIQNAKGSLDEIANAYGPDALVRTADAVTFASNAIPGIGVEPIAVGRAFGLKPGARTAPFEGQGGVLMVELTQRTNAPETTDYTAAKQQLNTQRSSRAQASAFEAIKDKADIKDNRVRFF